MIEKIASVSLSLSKAMKHALSQIQFDPPVNGLKTHLHAFKNVPIVFVLETLMNKVDPGIPKEK